MGTMVPATQKERKNLRQRAQHLLLWPVPLFLMLAEPASLMPLDST